MYDVCSSKVLQVTKSKYWPTSYGHFSSTSLLTTTSQATTVSCGAAAYAFEKAGRWQEAEQVSLGVRWNTKKSEEAVVLKGWFTTRRMSLY